MKRLLTYLLCVLIVIGLMNCKLSTPAEITPSDYPENTSPIPPTVIPPTIVPPTIIPPSINKPTAENTLKKSIATPSVTRTPNESLTGMPAFSDLPEGWSQIDPGGNTSCARGGKYSFFVRKANSNKLLIYFEGGGACYDAQTCRVGAHYFDDGIDPAYQADNPVLKTTGVFALSDERNPFKDYNIVFVSYCTGDAFMGNQVVSYTDGDKSFTVNHVGYRNAQRVLAWTYQNLTSPDSVFVIGCSAGVLGAFFHAPYMLEQYQNIPFTLVGDSGGGYVDGPASVLESMGTLAVLPDWLPQYQGLVTNGMIRSKLFFVIPAQAYSNARFGLLDTTKDNVQQEIISRFHQNLTLAEVIQSNLNDIRIDAPDFFSYTGPGDYHCITMTPDFYDYKVRENKLVDWFSSLANGQTVENIVP